MRIFLAEKGVTVPIKSVNLAAGEQFSTAYRKINPRCVVPALTLDDGTVIAEVLAIWRYFEEAYPKPALMGLVPTDKALVTMWERRAEQEGLAAAMEAVRNSAPGLKGRGLDGPHAYEQIPSLAERGKARVLNFYSDLDERLANSRFVAGDDFSVADITALTTIDFAAARLNLTIPDGHSALNSWFDRISERPSMAA